MRGDEVHAGLGAASLMVEEIGGCADARRELRQHALVAPPITPHRVAVAVVPLAPAGREASNAVAVRPQIPGFGDELDAGEPRRLADRVEEAAAWIEAMRLAAQRGGEIEAEPVDMHLHDLVA